MLRQEEVTFGRGGVRRPRDRGAESGRDAAVDQPTALESPGQIAQSVKESRLTVGSNVVKQVLAT